MNDKKRCKPQKMHNFEPNSKLCIHTCTLRKTKNYELCIHACALRKIMN